MLLVSWVLYTVANVVRLVFLVVYVICQLNILDNCQLTKQFMVQAFLVPLCILWLDICCANIERTDFYLCVLLLTQVWWLLGFSQVYCKKLLVEFPFLPWCSRNHMNLLNFGTCFSSLICIGDVCHVPHYISSFNSCSCVTFCLFWTFPVIAWPSRPSFQN